MVLVRTCLQPRLHALRYLSTLAPPPPATPAGCGPAPVCDVGDSSHSPSASSRAVPSREPFGRFDDLTRQLEAGDAKLVPTPEMHARKHWLATTLKPLLEKHTGGVLHFFGSCENGFWMNGSDVDACLVMRRCTQRQSWFTRLRLVQSLVERDQLGTAQLVRGARVPVAKIHDADEVELCDISVNNVAALENSRFVGALARLDPRICVLGRFIKHWASRRRINNRSEGTLSTYTLILQLFFFLQKQEPPLLPVVSDLLVDGLVAENSGLGAAAEAHETRCVNTWAAGPEMDVSSGELRPLLFLSDAPAIRQGPFNSVVKNEESLGKLLHGFFQFWGQDEFRGGDEGNGQTVLTYDGTRELNDLAVLVMRCPLTGKNVNPFTASVWRAIHAEFERAAQLLVQGCSLEELCKAAEESPAGRSARPQR